MAIKKIFQSNLVKNISSLTIIQLANYAIPLLIIPFLSRIVGIENYGKLEYARVFVLYFTILIDYGFDYTATRDISINRNDPRKINQIVSEVYASKLMLFILSSAIFLAFILFDTNASNNQHILTITYLINIGFLLFPLWFFQGIEKISSIAYINFIIKIGILSSVILLLKNKNDYWIYNLLQSISQIIAGLVAVYILIYKYKIVFISISFKSILRRLKDSFTVFISTLFVSIIASYSFLILKNNATEVEIGAYSTAFKLAITVQTIIILPFSQAFYPYMAKKANEDLIDFSKKINKATYLLILLNIFIILCSYILAPTIITLLFGEEYLVSLDSFRILIFLPLFACLTNLFSYQGLLNLKEDKTFLFIHVTFAIITIVLSHIIVPHLGLKGTVYLRVLIEIALMGVSYILFKKNLNKKLCQQ